MRLCAEAVFAGALCVRQCAGRIQEGTSSAGNVRGCNVWKQAFTAVLLSYFVRVWAEGTFAALKREHNLKRIHKRGIIRAEEECLTTFSRTLKKRQAELYQRLDAFYP